MARYIQRPENALKRANEFIDVGKPARALDTLQEVFRNKKWTYTWSESVIEPIMFKYLDLCVELKKSHIAKEGLFQYRNMFQLVNVGSLENVIRGYLKMAEKRTEEAQKQSSEAVVEVYDLENPTTPESILMSAVSGEDAQDRSDRTILLPWVKFLWESYCQCLELLRINSHCENLYHDIARMAFQFCLKYSCKMEFRKLCEKLRKHLDDICKPSTQAANVSITRPETQQLNLDTRLYQLDSAIQMELWQEAYKAIEDIHGLMQLSKKQPLPKTMANYYQKLAMVFWKAGNKLFHAAALLKFFQLSREMKKNITNDELQRLASHVLIATLSIPLPSAHPEFDRFIETDKSPYEKAQRLAVLLGLSQPPTRISLLKEIHRMNVVELADPLYQNLYRWLENEFDPLLLCARVQTCADQMNGEENSHLAQYVAAIQHVTLVRLVKQVSQVYQSITFERILSLAKFSTSFYLERILVDCVRHNDMQISIDHKNKCINFGTDLTESKKQEHPDGPLLQSMPSEQIRSQLVNMSVVLHRAVATINPNRQKADRDALRTNLVQHYHDTKYKAHQMILQRQKIIEERKEQIEQLNVLREEEELRRQEEQVRQLKLAEHKKLELEQEELRRKKHENEVAMIKERNLKERVQAMSTTVIGKKVLEKLEKDVKELDPDQLAAIEHDQMAKERKELQSKLKSQEKKIDYYERAKRLEEIPLLEEFLKKKQIEDKAFWEKQEADRIENAIAERKHQLAARDRLTRMYGDRDIFMNALREERKSEFVEKLKAFELYLEEERKKRLVQRIEQRRKDRRAAWMREKEEERRRIEDEIRKQKEEEERVEREKRAKLREAELEKLKLQAEKQRLMEERAEQKLAEERAQMTSREPKEAAPQSAWRKPAPVGGDASEWRRAPAAKPDEADRPTAAAAARDDGGKSEAWRPKFRNIDSEAPASPDSNWRRAGAPSERRDDRRDDRREPGDEPIRRGGGDRDDRRGGGGFRRDDRERRDEPIRRSGEDTPMRRSGEDRNEERRGGDRRDGERRDGERRDGDRRDGERRDGGERRRFGDDRRGGGAAGTGERREGGGFRREDRGKRDERDPTEWRRRPAEENSDSTNWRTQGPPKDEQRRGGDRPPREDRRDDRRQPATDKAPREDNEWRDVKRR